jgi:hypothetical protein
LPVAEIADRKPSVFRKRGDQRLRRNSLKNGVTNPFREARYMDDDEIDIVVVREVTRTEGTPKAARSLASFTSRPSPNGKTPLSLSLGSVGPRRKFKRNKQRRQKF